MKKILITVAMIVSVGMSLLGCSNEPAKTSANQENAQGTNSETETILPSPEGTSSEESAAQAGTADLSGEASGTVFMNDAQTFQVQTALPLTKSASGNEYHLVLDNEDQSVSLLCQQIEKNGAITSLDSFATYHIQSSFGNIPKEDMTEMTDISVPGAVSAKQFYLETTQQGITAVAQVTYIETENNYYSFCTTGLKKQYEEVKNEVEAIYSTFKEIE